MNAVHASAAVAIAYATVRDRRMASKFDALGAGAAGNERMAKMLPSRRVLLR